MALLFSLITALFNTGLIWTIQLVHYPGFLHIPDDGSASYHSFHMQSITPLVGVSMGLEVVAGVWLLLDKWPDLNMWIIASGVLLVAVWAHTIFIAVPLHQQLVSTFDTETVRRLIATNWWRTAAWTLRSAILLFQVSLLLGR